MKTSKFTALLAFCFALLTACSAPEFLPVAEEIGENPYGSYIDIQLLDKSEIEGELIAVEEEQIWVWAEYKEVNLVKKLKAVAKKDIKSFRVKYLNPQPYTKFLVGSLLLTPLHGYWLIYSFPLDTIAGILVSLEGTGDYMYRDNQISYRQLKMFARYPQGLPPNLDLEAQSK